MIQYLGCAGARDMLEAFVDEELPVSDQVRLETHLRWCETCRARVEDLQIIGSALRVGSPALTIDAREAALVRMVHDEVLARLAAEHDQSFGVRFREAVTDVRYLWPALGATFALLLCVYGATSISEVVRAVRPDSMAAVISTLANPGSDANPLSLDADMLAPRPLDIGPALSIPEGDAVFALAAVVTREGRISNYELLLSEREGSVRRRGAAHSRDVTQLLDAVGQSRFEPAQTIDGKVAVNVVWLLARTTVRGTMKAAADPAVSGELARPVPRPARS